MKAVAVIPARGGSKGIPHKNLQQINGLPLIGWAIRAAEKAVALDAVYVSTEDDDIGAVAKQLGARVIWRPAELAADGTHTAPVIQHAIRTLEGCSLDYVVAVECTSPLISPEDIDAVLVSLADDRNGYDVVTTVCRDNGFLLREGPDGIEWLSHNRSNHDCRRQDLPPTYRLAGGVYAYRPEALLWMGTAFYGKVGIVEIPVERAIDINTPLDLKVARAIVADSKSIDVVYAGP